MVNQARGSIFKRTDGKYFIYLPTKLVEDTAFPLKIGKHATKIWKIQTWRQETNN
jgi:hypothetical protein